MTDLSASHGTVSLDALRWHGLADLPPADREAILARLDHIAELAEVARTPPEPRTGRPDGHGTTLPP